MSDENILEEKIETQYGWYDPDKKGYVGLNWRSIDAASDRYDYNPSNHDRFLVCQNNIYWAELRDSIEGALHLRDTFNETDNWWLIKKETHTTIRKSD